MNDNQVIKSVLIRGVAIGGRDLTRGEEPYKRVDYYTGYLKSLRTEIFLKKKITDMPGVIWYFEPHGILSPGSIFQGFKIPYDTGTSYMK